MLELAVLGLLKEKPMSGYELQKALTAKLGAFWRVSFGSLYPCLKRLSAKGALEVLDSSYMSRKKHVYRLTADGETLFQELLESADVHDFEQDRFSLRLAFFRYLQPESRLDQLERRRGYLQQRLAELRSSLRAARDRLDAYTQSLMDHGLEEREREIAWLDRLIAAERGAGGLDRRVAAEGPGPGPPASTQLGGREGRSTGRRRRGSSADGGRPMAQRRRTGRGRRATARGSQATEGEAVDTAGSRPQTQEPEPPPQEQAPATVHGTQVPQDDIGQAPTPSEPASPQRPAGPHT